MSWIGGSEPGGAYPAGGVRPLGVELWKFPRCQIDKRRRVEGCGEIRVCLDLKEGAIQALSFYGDFFSRKEPDQLARRLIGCPLREEALRATVPAGEIGQYFQNMDLDEFCGLMLC